MPDLKKKNIIDQLKYSNCWTIEEIEAYISLHYGSYDSNVCMRTFFYDIMKRILEIEYKNNGRVT